MEIAQLAIGGYYGIMGFIIINYDNSIVNNNIFSYNFGS
jgi:hypothetical protein